MQATSLRVVPDLYVGYGNDEENNTVLCYLFGTVYCHFGILCIGPIPGSVHHCLFCSDSFLLPTGFGYCFTPWEEQSEKSDVPGGLWNRHVARPSLRGCGTLSPVISLIVDIKYKPS